MWHFKQAETLADVGQDLFPFGFWNFRLFVGTVPSAKCFRVNKPANFVFRIRPSFNLDGRRLFALGVFHTMYVRDGDDEVRATNRLVI